MTAKRLEKLKPILEKYKTLLNNSGKFDADAFEKEARIALNKMWYQQFKLVAIDLYKKNRRYGLVAKYYMENCGAPHMCTEFKVVLGIT